MSNHKSGSIITFTNSVLRVLHTLSLLHVSFSVRQTLSFLCSALFNHVPSYSDNGIHSSQEDSPPSHISERVTSTLPCSLHSIHTGLLAILGQTDCPASGPYWFLLCLGSVLPDILLTCSLALGALLPLLPKQKIPLTTFYKMLTPHCHHLLPLPILFTLLLYTTYHHLTYNILCQLLSFDSRPWIQGLYQLSS